MPKPSDTNPTENPNIPEAEKPSKPSKFMKKQPKVDPLAEMTADLQRVQADFENFKKRVASERSELMNSAKLSVLSDLLPALDNFDRAATHLPEHLAGDPWAQGMSYVGTQLETILADMGVKKFDPTGQEFDATEHEALEYVESEKPEGIVLETLTPGYIIGDRVVRPATVRVSSGTHPPNELQDTDKNEGDEQ